MIRWLMADDPKTLDRVFPSAVPNEEDIRAWEALPREEQLRRLRASLSHPDCSTVSPATMGEILAEARRRANARTRG
jgi:hypothetical protein